MTLATGVMRRQEMTLMTAAARRKASFAGGGGSVQSAAAFGRLERASMRMPGIRQFLRLAVVPARP